MQTRTVTFFSEGQKLVGTLRVPEGLTTPRPAVVCCQGFSLTRDVFLPRNAEALVAAGYVTLNLDYRYFGESEGLPRCRLVPKAQVEDVRNALTFLETVPEVDASKLGVFGISLGCSVATAVAGVDARVKALVAVAGPGDLERVWTNFPDFARFRAKVVAARRKYVSTGEVTYIGVPRLLASDPATCALLVAEQPKYPTWRLEVTFESLLDLFDFKPELTAPAIRGASLFIGPAADALISKNELVSLYSRAPEPRKLVMLEGLEHHEVYDDGRGFAPVMAATLEWLGEHLPAR
jgi:alpha-beta hydrolase superfamily lysophospholipase